MENNLRTTENYAAFMGDFTVNNGGKMNIEKEIEEMKSKIVMIEAELKKQEAKPKDFELFVKIETEIDNLVIGFNSACDFCVLGRITHEGKCYFLTHEIYHEHWEVWKQKGFKVAEQETIEWQGLGWYLCSNGKLVSGEPGNPFLCDSIYYFQDKNTVRSIYCDNGFLKKDSDRRIHLY